MIERIKKLETNNQIKTLRGGENGRRPVISLNIYTSMC